MISGESGEVSGKTVESWKEHLPEIVEGYKAEDIWNMEESGCFWKALPDKGLAQKGKSCKGSKKANNEEQLLFSSMLREKRNTNQLLFGNQRNLTASNELTKPNYLFKCGSHLQMWSHIYKCCTTLIFGTNGVPMLS